jgi:ubiquinone biosynthesis UbiH/UbiF/VisC/COQ6 family hydroxylase
MARYDVVIAGAGLPGLALATALARHGLAVALADRAPIAAAPRPASAAVAPKPASPQAPANAPPDAAAHDAWDVRIYAISPGSASFLAGIGAWQHVPLARLRAVERMHIEGDGAGTLEFSAYDLGERALAWICEESALRAALLRSVHAAGVTPYGGVPFERLAWSPEQATLALADGTALEAPLVVGADGINSWVRAQAGLVAAPRAYGQTAVVANFTAAQPHHGCARQWFRRDGAVLAWLPLPGRDLSIVWSAPDAEATRLLALAPGALAAEVAAAGGRVLGDLQPAGPAAGFPLQYLRLPTSIAHRLALVGDAAHGIHPLAGQGVNLGFGDAEALAGVLASRAPVTDPGEPALLTRYARRRAEPVLAMQLVTDGLARLFGQPAPWLRLLRNAGLSAVDRLPALKRALAQPALR